MVGKTGFRLRHPVALHRAVCRRRSSLGIAVEHGIDLLQHGDVRAARREHDHRHLCGEIVRRGLPAGENGFVQRPCARVRQHVIPHHLGERVHGDDRVIRTRRAGRRVRGGNGCARRIGHGICKPRLRLFAEEFVDRRVVRPAMGVPARRVAQRQHVEGVEGDDGVKPVVIALRRMDGLGAPHLLRRLAHEAERAGDAVLLHRRLGRERADERAHAECRMRVRVPTCKARQALARLAPRHRRLAVAGHRIIFGIGHDGGPRPVGPCGGEGGGHAARAFLHRKALGAQALHVPLRRAVFPPRRLGQVPDVAVPRRPVGMSLIHPAQGMAVCGIAHDRTPISLAAACCRSSSLKPAKLSSSPCSRLRPA